MIADEACWERGCACHDGRDSPGVELVKKREWVGLTDEDVNRESAPIAQQMKLAFHAGMYVAQKLLKERNT
jgi:hypothetical protein